MSTTTTETRVKLYEGLFLFPQSASADLTAAVDHVRSLLDRAKAEVLSLTKWDERRLAYDIDGNKRGLYLLAYFKAPTTNLAGLDRDCNLSEKLLRALIIRADHLDDELVEVKVRDGARRLEDEMRLRGNPDASPDVDADIEDDDFDE
ncbi:MAG: 30S ribosomal protein S6 [Phycisphaerales bacterium]